MRKGMGHSAVSTIKVHKTIVHINFKKKKMIHHAKTLVMLDICLNCMNNHQTIIKCIDLKTIPLSYS